MLHSLPALLDELERRLVAGEDPLPLMGSIRWPEVIDWPTNLQEALTLKRRLSGISALLHGLQAPLRATLMGLSQESSYQPKGGQTLPKVISLGFHHSV